MVVSSISLKQISLHRCLAEGLWFSVYFACGPLVTSNRSVAMDTVNKGGYHVNNCIVKF